MNTPNKLTVARMILVPFLVLFMLTDLGGEANRYIVSMDNLGLNNKTDSYEYKIQKLNHKYLLLQHALLTNPEGYEILSVRDVTSMFTELRQTP